jgi:outer membrane receptor for ferrienterochelin and colicins
MKKLITNLKAITIVLSALFVTSSAAFAQNTVSGTIKDSKTKEAIIGASVQLAGTNIGAMTDENGYFKLDSKQAFPWKIIVSFVGFDTYQLTVNSAKTNMLIVLNQSTSMMSEVIVSASRRAEKVQEAPASVSVISSKTLQAASSAIDPTRELVNVPGVQIQQQSAQRFNIEMRGASSLFSTAVYPMLDYRGLVGAGTGTFQSDASGINTIDLQRIEVVRGPASALYGPGVTSGVVHFISKNPIDFPGTTIELMGGQLNTFGGVIRHAMVSKDKKMGFKINAHYKKGNEFSLNPSDTSDAKQIAKFKKQIVDPIINTEGVVAADQTKAPVLYTQQQLDPDGDGNMMSNYWENASINGTFEYRPMADTKIIAAGGFNKVHGVFYNAQGEGLTQATEYWSQVRFQKKGLFAQAFYVNNDGGTGKNPTFLYQTGNRTPIARQQLEGQVQYNFGIKTFLNSDFTVGADYRSALSNTFNKVYGRNENDDDFTIMGGYAQAKFKLSPQINMVLAGRYDKFNFSDEGAFSPRAALVYNLTKEQSFRASFNRAFVPPSSLNLNIDFPVSTPVAGLFDVWLRGNKKPQTFATNPMIDLTGPGFPNLPYGTPGLPLAIAYNAVTPSILPQLQATIPANVWPAVQAILTNPANVPKGTTGTFTGYNLFTGQPLTPINAPIAQLQEDNTLEFGYKGTFKNKFSVALDVYHVQSKNFTNFTAISPTIRFTNTSLASDLSKAVIATLTPQLEAALIANGISPLTAASLAAQVSTGVAVAYTQAGTAFSNQIAPLTAIFGAVETDGVPQDGMVHNAVGYRTYGKIAYWGVDLSFGYQINNDFSLFANYSTLSQTDFNATDLGEAANSGLVYNLSVPKSKFRLGATYAPDYAWRGNISFQHDDSFVSNFGQYSGNTDVKNLVDAGVGYKLKSGLSLDLTCTNFFDQKYRAFPNLPKIGRRAIVRLVYDFGK